MITKTIPFQKNNKIALFLSEKHFIQMLEMARRVTIMIDDELDKKLRLLQAKLIQKENKSISYSHVVNSMLKDSMKK